MGKNWMVVTSRWTKPGPGQKEAVVAEDMEVVVVAEEGTGILREDDPDISSD
jgi:hypothetical protein